MRSSVKRQIEEVNQLRSQLAEIEAKRRMFAQDPPQEIYQEFLILTQQLEQAEENIRQSCSAISENINRIRDQIQVTHTQYDLMRKKMAESEELFMINILHPWNLLRRATLQKEYLKEEFKRIQAAIEKEAYADQAELEADIQAVLVNGETIRSEAITKAEQDQREKDELLSRMDELETEDVKDAIRISKIISEFKEIVLPATHPDTSSAPPEVFEAVFDVYEKLDILLMEAYVIEYKGELKLDSHAGSLHDLEDLSKKEEYYLQVLSGLKKRYARLKQDVSAKELKDPQAVKAKMERHRLELLKNLQDEEREINHWREKIESLQ